MSKNKSIVSDSLEENRETIKHAAKVEAIDKDISRNLATARLIDQVLDDGISDEEWNSIKESIKYNFPDIVHSKYSDLSAKQKIAAVADIEGWSMRKISERSGVSRGTLQRWFRRPDFLLFQRDYKQVMGSESFNSKISAQAYKAMLFYDEILSDRDTSDSARQLKAKIAMYITDRAFEIEKITGALGLDMNKLQEMFKRMKNDSISPEEAFSDGEPEDSETD